MKKLCILIFLAVIVIAGYSKSPDYYKKTKKKVTYTDQFSNPIGYSETTVDSKGNEETIYYDTYYNVIGTSEKKKGKEKGEEYFDTYYNKIGESTEIKSIYDDDEEEDDDDESEDINYYDYNYMHQ
jgi:hypothetical protein